MARIFNASTGTRPTGWAISRTSTATYINSSGLVATASSNAERLNYNGSGTLLGLLIEPAGTNEFVKSGDLMDAAWTDAINGGGNVKGTITTAPAGLLAPDGSSQAFRLALTGTSITGVLQTVSLSSATEGITFWAKSSSSSPASNIRVTTWTTAASTGMSQKFALTSSWQRFTVSPTLLYGSGGPSTNILFGASDASFAYDATCAGNADFAFPAVGQTVSSYIPTTTTSATRAADDYSFTLAATATQLTFTFDDASTQVVSGLTGSSTYHVPTNLTRSNVLYIDDNSTGGGTTTGAGSSSGAGTATGQGAATKAAGGSSAGVGSASAVGSATVSGAGSSAGVGAVSGVGSSQTTVSGAGSSSGVGTASGVGASSAAGQGAGTSAGLSTVAGAGGATVASIGSAAGLGSAVATGLFQTTLTGVGTAAGLSSVSGVAPVYQVLSAAGLSFGTGAAFGTPYVPIPVIIGDGNRLLTPLVSVDHDVFGYKPGHRSTGSNSSARGREAPARRPYAETWD